MNHYFRWLISFAIGCALGVMAHYLLHRMSLPVEPFIYTAF